MISQHLRTRKTLKVARALRRKSAHHSEDIAQERLGVCRRGCSTTGRNSEVLEPADPTSRSLFAQVSVRSVH